MKSTKVYRQCNKMCMNCNTKESKNGCVGTKYCKSWQRLRCTITIK